MPDTRNKPYLLHLGGFTRADRLRSVALIRDAINGTNGWITDFHEFSNLSICIEFEIPEASLPSLTAKLISSEISFNSRTERTVRSLQIGTAGEPVQCTLQVLFIHDEPDLRRTVLAVPG
jgi:hypothetical protein